MLQQIVESFFQKVGEKLVDYAQNNATDITNLKLDVTTLEIGLKSLCAIAFDVEDKIKTDASGKKKRKREVGDWLKQVQLIQTDFLELQSRGYITRLLSGGRVATLTKRINDLVEQSRHFGEVLVEDYDQRGEAFLTAEMFGEAFEENSDILWELLVDDKVESVGIYGMGGVGKTTLMKRIHNRLLQETQDCVCWVTVSQVFSVNKLQDEIAHAMGIKLSDEHADTDRKAAELSKALSTRESIVLILDDVWEYIRLEKVGFPLGREGCRLVITTRSLKVSSIWLQEDK